MIFGTSVFWEIWRQLEVIATLLGYAWFHLYVLILHTGILKEESFILVFLLWLLLCLLLKQRILHGILFATWMILITACGLGGLASDCTECVKFSFERLLNVYGGRLVSLRSHAVVGLRALGMVTDNNILWCISFSAMLGSICDRICGF